MGLLHKYSIVHTVISLMHCGVRMTPVNMMWWGGGGEAFNFSLEQKDLAKCFVY